MTELDPSEAVIAPKSNCSICGKPTDWGGLTVKMGEKSNSRWFCENCANSFLLVNTAVSMMLKQFFAGGPKIENNQVPELPI
jgi:hypothetical protein